ncbi:unnamed protein product [Heligmosomoides polygyrus]|uniref:RRM domain-containing protein n=1 Tax=Heligmosomoides polygyrus TaxID=6339 RepID=A0A183GH52_HELPZ|nr:unnamed protein product [Heligmosomoides polygyrus]
MLRLQTSATCPTYQCRKKDIGNLFSQAGQVTYYRIVMDRENGRAEGFGFANAAGAENTVNTLNGTDFNGRSLRVNHASRI